jgi:acyl-CoA-binding protein
MSDLKAKFEKASVDVKQLTSRPDNNSLLKLYALYKQATEGDVSGDKPKLSDYKARLKYEAWKKVQGTSSEDAMNQYVAMVEKLQTS